MRFLLALCLMTVSAASVFAAQTEAPACWAQSPATLDKVDLKHDPLHHYFSGKLGLYNIGVLQKESGVVVSITQTALSQRANLFVRANDAGAFSVGHSTGLDYFTPDVVVGCKSLREF